MSDSPGYDFSDPLLVFAPDDPDLPGVRKWAEDQVESRRREFIAAMMEALARETAVVAKDDTSVKSWENDKLQGWYSVATASSRYDVLSAYLETLPEPTPEKPSVPSRQVRRATARKAST